MGSRKAVRLLIVNDHKEFCDEVEGAADLFRHELEISCRSASSGEDALRTIRDWDPSIILLDAHIPGSHGFDILERYRHGSARIIVTSQHRSQEIEDSALEHGAAGYVVAITGTDEIEGLMHSISAIASDAETSH